MQHIKDALAKLDAVYAAYAEPDADFDKIAAEQARLEAIIQATDGHNLERQLEVAADALRLPPWDADVTKISGGERRRVALCQLLLSKPDMLLLDEPTNHLDAESVRWLEHYLEQYPGTVIAVTHDRYFLDNVAGWILELDRGHGIPWQGNYSSWLEQKEKRLQIEEQQQDGAQEDARARARMGAPEPEGAPGQEQGAHAALRGTAVARVPGAQRDERDLHPAGPAPGRARDRGARPLEVLRREAAVRRLDFNLPQGGIVGIIGPNGAGKTTLFRIMTGKEKPDAGEIRVGPSVQLAYVDQSRQSLDDSKTVWDEISNGLDMIKVGNYETPSRAYVGRFNFRGSQQQQSIGELSGGERNRVHLAKVLKEGGNVILLDEPTNDLDVETLRALEEALLSFPGCAVVISHDRWFLDRIATHILAFEGNSEVVWFEGNYSEYVEDLKKRRGEDAEQPHRVRFRSLHA